MSETQLSIGSEEESRRSLPARLRIAEEKAAALRAKMEAREAKQRKRDERRQRLIAQGKTPLAGTALLWARITELEKRVAALEKS